MLMSKGFLRSICVIGAVGIPLVMPFGTAQAQAAPDPFRWKQLTVTVSFSPGGPYDMYARLLARHIGRHLPGNPNVVVGNMPGAAGLKAANYIFNTAPRDGSEIGLILRGLPMELRKDTNARFESDKFGWVGSMNKELSVFTFMQNPPIGLDDILKGKEVPVGATGAASDGAIFSHMMNKLLGTRLKIIPGYPGVVETLLAMEQGEITGTAAMTLSALRTQKPEWIATQRAKVLLQISVVRSAALPDVPAIKELVVSEEDRQVIDFILICQDLGRPLIAPPGLPAGRLETLRSAFLSTMNDSETKSDAAKLSFDLDFISGVEAQNMIAKLVTTPASILSKARELYPE